MYALGFARLEDLHLVSPDACDSCRATLRNEFCSNNEPSAE